MIITHIPIPTMSASKELYVLRPARVKSDKCLVCNIENNFLAKILISLKLVAGQKTLLYCLSWKTQKPILVLRRNLPTMFQTEERTTNSQTK